MSEDTTNGQHAAPTPNPYWPDSQGHHYVAPPGADGDYAYCRDCGIRLTNTRRRDIPCSKKDPLDEIKAKVARENIAARRQSGIDGVTP